MAQTTEAMAEGQNTENTYHSKDKPTNSCKTQVIRLVDITLACLILAPVVVIYWRTTWLLMDFYIYPQHRMTSACISLVVGFASSLLIVLCQRDFVTFLCEFDELISKIIWKMCMYPISVSCVSYWRGVWMVTDLTTTISLTSLILCHSLSFVLLSVLRTASSVVSAPGFYVNDLHVSISTVTITNIPWSRDKYAFIKYIVNCLLTVSIVGTLVVVFWRGTWLLWDLITDFDTTNNVYDHLLCYGISSGICTICYLISRPFELFLINSTSCPTWFKIVLEHVFVYVLACCSVNIWRSAWYIWDLLFLTGSPVQAAFISHFVSLFLLYAGQAAHNITGSPIGCRTHGSNTLEGLYMGSYLTLTQPISKLNNRTETNNKTP